MRLTEICKLCQLRKFFRSGQFPRGIGFDCNEASLHCLNIREWRISRISPEKSEASQASQGYSTNGYWRRLWEIRATQGVHKYSQFIQRNRARTWTESYHSNLRQPTHDSNNISCASKIWSVMHRVGSGRYSDRWLPISWHLSKMAQNGITIQNGERHYSRQHSVHEAPRALISFESGRSSALSDR
jgi:hypothetical protein